MSGLSISKAHKRKLSLPIALFVLMMLVQPVAIFTYNERMVLEKQTAHNSSAENPYLTLTYYRLTNLTEAPVVSNSMIVGDHVIIKASWTPSIVNRSRLQIIAPAIPATLTQDLNTYVTELDTRYLGNNATCTINATAWLTNGSVVSQKFENVYIGNFFAPQIVVISPNGNEIWSGKNNITWWASDLNIDDTLWFILRISSNGGNTFETLATSISQRWFEWDCTGLDKLDTYLVEVTVTDGIYFATDQSDSTFTAGNVIYTTTPSTPTSTTTTTTTNGLDPRLAAFIVILLISSSLMAAVVYFAARKWF